MKSIFQALNGSLVETGYEAHMALLHRVPVQIAAREVWLR